MPIRVDMLANTRDAVRGVKDYGEALEDVSGSLDDVARDAQRSGDRVADSLTDAARDGEKTADRLEQSFKQASDATADNYKAATARIRAETDKLNQSGRDAFAGPSKSVEEFKDEAKSNLSEVTSSFTGSMDSVQDLVQGTFGGLAASGGPLGLGFAAAAVAAGFIGQNIANANEEADALKERTQSLADEFVSDFATAYEAGDRLGKGLAEWATDSDKYGVSLGDAGLLAKQAGVDFGSFARAIATQSIPALEREQKALQARSRTLQEQARIAGDSNDPFKAAALRTQYEAEAAAIDDKLLPAINQSLSAHTAAEQAYKSMAEAQGKSVEQYKAEQEALDQASEATQDYASSVQDAYADAGSAVEDYVEDGVFNLDKYAEATQKNLDTIVNYQKNMSDAQGILARSGHDTALQYLEQLGPDAAPLIEAFVQAPAAKQDELAAIWQQLGATSADSFGTKLQGDLDATPTTKRVQVDLDRTAYDRSLSAILAENLHQTVDVFVNDPRNQYVAPRPGRPRI